MGDGKNQPHGGQRDEDGDALYGRKRTARVADVAQKHRDEKRRDRSDGIRACRLRRAGNRRNEARAAWVRLRHAH